MKVMTNLRLIPFIFIALLLLTWSNNSFAQKQEKISIELGEKYFSLNKFFTITVSIQNSPNRDAGSFPEIKGLKKRGLNTSTLTDATGNISHKISQNYVALQEGSLVIPPFSIMINGQNIRSEGSVVVVTKPLSKDEKDETEDIANFIEGEPPIVSPEIKGDAFLALNISKNQVFVGEGFTATLAFYVAETNTAEMEFFELDTQLAQILRQIKPTSCWEENFGLKEVQAIPVKIKGKPFTEYRLYQATFFPISNRPIVFQGVSLKLKKIIGANSKKNMFDVYTIKPQTIGVKKIPYQILNSNVAVGNFRIEEEISTLRPITGKSFRYRFHIVGEGNLATVQLPMITNDSLFDFYTPEVLQTVFRQNGKVTGNKVFSFEIVPKQAGNFALKDYIHFAFFNPQTQKYEQLSSQIDLRISGKKVETETLDKSESGMIYEGLENQSSANGWIDYRFLARKIANLLIFAMLIGMIYIFWERKHKKE